MRRKYQIHTGKETIERRYNYIPVRYIVAVMITVFEIAAVIGAVVACCYYIPFYYLAAWLRSAFCSVLSAA